MNWNLKHVIVEEQLELVAAWSQRRTNRRTAPGSRRAPRPAPLPLHHPGTHFGVPGRRPRPSYRSVQVVPVGAWVAHPKEATLPDRVLRATTPEGVSPIIGPVSLSSPTPGLISGLMELPES